MLTSFATTLGSSKIPKIQIEIEVPTSSTKKFITPNGEILAVAGAITGSISATVDVAKAVGTGGVINAISGDSAESIEANEIKELREKWGEGSFDDIDSSSNTIIENMEKKSEQIIFSNI